MQVSKEESIAQLEIQPSLTRRFLKRLWHDRWIYIFLVPFLILFAMYTIWPIISSYYFSLLDWNGFDKSGTFVGLDNYVEIINDPLFWDSFKNTFVFMLFTAPTRMVIALIFAVILNDKRLPFANIFRTALFLPVVTTMAIVGVVMIFIFDPIGGPINIALREVGLIDRPIDFLNQSSTALNAAMGIHVWKWLGITLIYWLAALQTIPEELYEAARVDGASSFQLFIHITIPLLIPFVFIIFLLEAIFSLRVFALILTLTGGGPFFSTEVVEVYIYRWAFASTIPRLGYASAAAVFFGLTTMLLAIGQGFILQRLRQWRRA